MRILKVIALYIASFFVVGFGCGLDPLKLLTALSGSLKYISPNLAYINPFSDGISPLFIFILSFVLGSILVFVLAAFAREWKNIFPDFAIGLLVIHFIFSCSQYLGLITDLRRDFKFDGWRIVQVGRYWSGPERPKLLAEQVKMALPDLRMQLMIKSDFSMEKDPYFYLIRNLSYQLYPVDVRGIRTGNLDGVLYIDVQNLPEPAASEYKTLIVFEKGFAVAFNDPVSLGE